MLFQFIGPAKKTLANLDKVEIIELDKENIILHFSKSHWVYPCNDEQHAKETFEKIKDILS